MNKDLISTSEIIKKYNLATKKSLGQNFILDKNFTDKIVSFAGNLEESEILEIGPGPGSLTRSILDKNPLKLTSVEIDNQCILALQEFQEFYGEKFQLITGDALKINELEIFKDYISNGKKFKIIANLPYNIGTILLFKWLKITKHISSIHLMLQKEVVERIIAKKGDKHYGRLAIMVNLLCSTKMKMTVNRNIFSPPPKVTSAIIEIIPRDKKLFDADFAKLERVVKCAFSMRRKMLKSSLKSIFKNPEEILINLKIDPKNRPENLDIEDFCKIANSL
jgi:16S rRNA (adenine1518-N6/adenine1519-N6)-dimethyltransferase